jgi:hypothetical protein
VERKRLKAESMIVLRRDPSFVGMTRGRGFTVAVHHKVQIKDCFVPRNVENVAFEFAVRFKYGVLTKVVLYN